MEKTIETEEKNDNKHETNRLNMILIAIFVMSVINFVTQILKG